MRKRGQGVSLVVIMGIVIVIIISLLSFSFYRRSVSQLETVQENKFQIINIKSFVEESIENCIYTGIIEVMPETGIRATTKQDYEIQLSENISRCSEGILDEFENQGFEITRSPVFSDLSFTDETIIADINYKIIMEKPPERIEFNNFKITFNRINFEFFSQKRTNKITLVNSNDGRAFLKLLPGTTFDNTQVSIKIEDLHFDNLENNVVVGNLIYEGLPDNIVFNRPVEVAIEVREKDIPQGITKDKLSIAWWDDKYQIWRALNTKVDDNTLFAETIHFTKFAVVVDCAPKDKQAAIIKDTSRLFTQKYSPTNQRYWALPGNPYVLAKDETLIDETPEDLPGENRIFGDGNCDFPPIQNPSGLRFNWCNKDEQEHRTDKSINCTNVPPGRNCGGSQECVVNRYSGNYVWCVCKTIPSWQDPSLYYSGPTSKIGYKNTDCVGGSVIDGNGDNEIASVNFLDKGNACIRKWTTENRCSPNDNCYSTIQEFATGNNFRLQVQSFTVENSYADAKAFGSVRFRIQGIGVI